MGGGATDLAGNLTLTNSGFSSNQALAGAGGSGSSAGATGGAGGTAVGGALYSVGVLIYNYTTGTETLTPATVTATNLALEDNLAEGGAGGAGDGSGEGGAGGAGMGGGAYNDAGSTLDISAHS